MNVPITERARLDFPGMRITSLPSNKEVQLPDPADNEEEAKLLAFKTEVFNAVEHYVKGNTARNSQSNKHFSNLSKSQNKGISDLRKKCQSEDLVIMETDKTKSYPL